LRTPGMRRRCTHRLLLDVARIRRACRKHSGFACSYRHLDGVSGIAFGKGAAIDGAGICNSDGVSAPRRPKAKNTRFPRKFAFGFKEVRGDMHMFSVRRCEGMMS